MTCEVESLAERQAFWKTLFEEEKLTSQLASLATKHVDHGVTYYDMTQYGQIHVKVESGSALGDNFQSDTFIVTVQMLCDTGEKTLSTFIKVLPSNIFIRKSVCKYRVHQREINIYQNFFKLLREIHRPDNEIPLDVPDVYYSHIEDIIPGETDGSGTCILLENLKAEGYRMADKVEGADYQHCHMALTSLAHYHALTLSALVEWVTSFTSRISEVILVDTLESSGPLGCILHGDYWINNILFKYDVKETNIPVSLKMLDFQTSRIGHPLSDVLYFFYSSTKPETREKHMLVLLRQYFNKLTDDLQLLSVSLDDYTWQDFLSDYKKRSLMLMFMGIMVLSFVLNKKTLTKLDEMDAEERLKEPKVSDEEKVKGESGMSLDVEESMRNMMSSQKLSDNPVLTDRILRLIDEVKTLNGS
ncbi:hypothetical protein DAPPUDRAFT_242233 [Daphnia pulex]|uniref:CHK kinase-like domain-containing protein n=1 Tax=Daphnia pulex TaxID=6669 RepID=E9GG59_DAPPU|nr:hypothetical protein DAPPUDRAFT_242233 [Daphnia pulex]|eukprot:EFX81341.1 hypothetical protein DAPPUDRAFT_242233 [Daphnia pulex]